jgi:hypothetical protein
MRKAFLKSFTFLAAAVLAAAASASARNSETITIGHQATVGGTSLPAGEYVVSWKTHSPEAEVTFRTMHGNQVVANLQGRIEKRDTRYENDMVVYEEAPDGSRKVVELRFAGSNKALVLSPAAAASGPSKSGALPTTKLAPQVVPGIGYALEFDGLSDRLQPSNNPSKGTQAVQTWKRM